MAKGLLLPDGQLKERRRARAGEWRGGECALASADGAGGAGDGGGARAGTGLDGGGAGVFLRWVEPGLCGVWVRGDSCAGG